MQVVPFDSLACPLDGQRLILDNNQFKCPDNHSFDIAKQRYVNLLPIQDKRSRHPGDSKEMVAARQRFLNTGVYQPIADKLNEMALGYTAESPADKVNVVDAGCGEGYYLNQLQLAAQDLQSDKKMAFLGIDIAKPAILSATQRNRESISWAVATNRKLPVVPNSIDVLLCMFGFPVFDAFKDGLSEQGCLLLVESGESHLIELREIVYDTVRSSPLPEHQAAAELGFKISEQGHICYQTPALQAEQIQDLLLMTPHFFKIKPEKREKIFNLSQLSLTVDVHFRLYSLA